MRHDSSKKLFNPSPQAKLTPERKKRPKFYPMSDLSQTKFCPLDFQLFMSQLRSITYFTVITEDQRQQQSALRCAKEECPVKSKYC